METKNIMALLMLISLVGAIISSVGFAKLKEEHQKLEEKYNMLLEKVQGSYGKITWIQDVSEKDAFATIQRMSTEDLQKLPKGSQYIFCEPLSGRSNETGICFYDPMFKFK